MAQVFFCPGRLCFLPWEAVRDAGGLKCRKNAGKMERTFKNAGKVAFEHIWEGLGKQICVATSCKKKHGILLVWVSLDTARKCLGRQVFFLNHVEIYGILLVWDFLDLSWECLAWALLSSKHAKICGILLVWISLDISWGVLVDRFRR